MISQHSSFAKESLLNRPVEGRHSWHCTELKELFDKAKFNHSEGNGIRPIPPSEAISLVVDGKYEEAVRGLSFILNGHDLLRATQKIAGAPFNEALEKIARGNIDVSLTRGQISVARMVHAMRVLGLDSSTHAGDRAIELVLPYRTRLEAGLSQRSTTTDSQFSQRLIGVASLLAAQASRDPSAQPCGVQVVRAAREKEIPCLMISSHHALGGDAVPLIAEHCSREGLLNGEISCQRLGFTNTAADTFWIFKQDPQAWTECFNRLGEVAADRSGGVLVVQDTVGAFSDDLLPFPIQEVIRATYLECPSLRNKPLTIVPDKEQALAALESLPFAAVATDLFMPTCAGSRDKSCGAATVREVLLPYLDHRNIDHLLYSAQAAEEEVSAIVTRELAELLTMQ